MKKLISILLVCTLLCGSFGCIAIRTINKYANADRYTAGAFTYEADKVQAVELDWAAGDVTLKQGTGTLSVSESGGETLSISERLHWWLDGTTLRIKYCESGFSHIIPTKDKDLTLELPENIDLKIDIASGRVRADTLTVKTLDLNTASGGVEIGTLTAREAEIDTASGGVTIGTATIEREFDVDTASGGLTVDRISAQTIKIDTASGGTTLGLDKVTTVDIDAASGKITLKLFDAEAGATVRLSKLSGSFDCKIPMTAEGKDYKIGNGAIRIDIDTASGGVEIE